MGYNALQANTKAGAPALKLAGSRYLDTVLSRQTLKLAGSRIFGNIKLSGCLVDVQVDVLTVGLVGVHAGTAGC